MLFEITEENFKEYFFPAKPDYKPQKGQCLACWRAKADFVDGWIKRNIIDLLASNKSGAEASQRIMVKLVSATQEDAVDVLIQMAQDLLAGLTPDEVTKKPYRFTVEQFYWTKEEYVPNDPHWTIININDLRVTSKILTSQTESASVVETSL